ncbi:hypothetical protein M9H77_12908 [Catharanthus roseus]|uniref:Uncharacterized protein n=1 Tax=Catharanthus roseus TaxID=4058 RepID=A0ACC0BIN4_CATRO|nr:hypothetical protein M9H77_12908 [Catharanthus roseus]
MENVNGKTKKTKTHQTFCLGLKGYLAPEYAMLGQLSHVMTANEESRLLSGRSSKAAFGGLLLVLVKWTWKLIEEDRLLEIVDQEMAEYPEAEVIGYIKLFCTQAATPQRLDMKQVVKMLSKDVSLNDQLLTETECSSCRRLFVN